jgi:hypothetical protein
VTSVDVLFALRDVFRAAGGVAWKGRREKGSMSVYPFSLRLDRWPADYGSEVVGLEPSTGTGTTPIPACSG